jgi:probable F420-dependent oxidoreductase
VNAELGAVLPNFGPEASMESVLRVAEVAEELGFDSVWTTEHLLVGDEAKERYSRTLDAIGCLEFLAARLHHIGLGTSIVILPLHHPVRLAKEAATLQLSSGNRLRLGVGVGWHRDEFEFLGVDFAGRGQRADEAVRLMRALWAGERSFRGDHWSFDDAHFGPLPEREPEIWVGGASPRSLRRAREHGATWHPNVADPESVAAARAEWPQARIVPRLQVRFSAGRSPLSGTPEEVAAALERLFDAGMAGAVLGFGDDEHDMVSGMRRFAGEVRPHVPALASGS